MERAQSNLKMSEKQLGQLLKKRARALADLQAAEARGVAPAQLAIRHQSVRDADLSITAAKGRVEMFRKTIFQLKQQRAAQKALKKKLKLESIANDSDDSSLDLIPAVHAAVSATATAEVASSTAKEALSVVDMALFFAGVGCIMIVGGTGLIAKKLRLW